MCRNEGLGHAAVPLFGPTLAHRAGDRAASTACRDGRTINLHALDERSRNEYLFARALIGQDYAFPVVASCDR